MPVTLNDFAKLWSEVSSDAQAALAEVGESGWYILGRQVQQFEDGLASYSRLSHAVGCASGLDAIELGLRALKIAPGQKVLTTPLSAFATTLAILRAGGQPFFVDVDENGQMDLDLAEEALRADSAIKMMVPVHLYGRSLDLSRLSQFRENLGVSIVEDMAQAIGATWEGRPVGSAGQIAATSFYPTKNLGCFGDGGAVLTNDPILAERCRSLRDYGQTAKYVHAEIGLNSRLDELQAALMTATSLPRLTGWTQKRREIARLYSQGIQHPNVTSPLPCDESVWHLYVVRATDRDDLMAHLNKHNIQSGVHYPRLIPDQDAMRGRGQGASGSFPTAQRLSKTSLSLPIHPYLSQNEAEQVIQVVNSWQPK